MILGFQVSAEDKYIVQVAKEVSRLKADSKLKEAYVMDNVDLEFKMYEQSKKVRAEAIKETQREDSSAYIETLIDLGQSKEKILNLLVQKMGLSKAEANTYYQEVVAG